MCLRKKSTACGRKALPAHHDRVQAKKFFTQCSKSVPVRRIKKYQVAYHTKAIQWFLGRLFKGIVKKWR